MLHLRHAFRTRPHFVACWVNELPAAAPWIARNIFGCPLLTWTVRTPEQRDVAARHADQMIFEGFRPGSLSAPPHLKSRAQCTIFGDVGHHARWLIAARDRFRSSMASSEISLEAVSSVSQIPAADWDACANPQIGPDSPQRARYAGFIRFRRRVRIVIKQPL